MSESNSFDLKNPIAAAVFKAALHRALKPKPKTGELFGPDGKPVTPVEMKELKPYELEPNEPVMGDYWESIQLVRGVIEFSGPDNHAAVCQADGSVLYRATEPCGHGGCDVVPVKLHWKQLAGKLGEILKTARANYGEDWGK
jgi:hypothetical protein